MQSRNGNDQRTEKSTADGRRNTERSPILPEGGMEHQEVPDVGNRTVCMSATLRGEGKAAA